LIETTLAGKGNLLVPISSNISVWRQPNGTNSFGGRVVGTLFVNSTVYNYGWQLITLNNQTGNLVPPNGTILDDIYVARSFNLVNRTQVEKKNLVWGVSSHVHREDLAIWSSGCRMSDNRRVQLD
jgi:hypothetical protein